MTPSSTPLPRSAPHEQGVDAAGVTALLDAVSDAGIELHSLMVLRHGHVVAEGWWAPFAPELPHLVYSLTKTFTSAAAGLAIAEGRFGLDDRMTEHFADLLPADVDEKYSRYLVRHALSMSSGHERETIDRALDARPDDLLAGFFAVPPEREPGTVFCYNQPTIHGVARLVARTSGQRLLDYLQPRLLDPLGITEAQWMLDVDGEEMGYSGLHVRTESLAKAGQLMLQEGEWQGDRILDAEWVRAATSVQTPNDTADRAPGPPEAVDWRQGYGFQYWRGRHGYRGDGAYGQFLLIWPEEDAVIVTTAETVEMPRLLELLTTHLLPAMRLDGDHDPAAEAALADRLAALALPLPDAGEGSFAGRYPLAAQGVVPGATELEIVDESDGSWTLRLAGAEFPVGRGEWSAGEWPAPDETVDAVPLRSAGGVHEDGVWRAQVRLIQTPHAMRVEVPPGGPARLSWRHEPLRADGPAGHALPRR